MPNLFDSFEKLVEACVRKSPQGATKFNPLWCTIRVISTVQESYRHNLGKQSVVI